MGVYSSFITRTGFGGYVIWPPGLHDDAYTHFWYIFLFIWPIFGLFLIVALVWPILAFVPLFGLFLPFWFILTYFGHFTPLSLCYERPHDLSTPPLDIWPVTNIDHCLPMLRCNIMLQ